MVFQMRHVQPIDSMQQTVPGNGGGGGAAAGDSSAHLRPMRTPKVIQGGPSPGVLLSAEEKRTMGKDEMAMYGQPGGIG